MWHLWHGRARFARLAAKLAVLAPVVLAPAAAHAGSLQVSPIIVSFAPTDQTQTLWLSNTGDEGVHAQVRVFAWSQIDGEDELAPTHDVVASPPIVSIEPHGRQLVRLVRLAPAPTNGTEQSYRLLVNEVPTADDKPLTPGLRFVLQYSIPVFLAPKPPEGAASAPQADGDGAAAETAVDASHLRVRFGRASNGQAELTVSNSGTTHVKIGDLAVIDAHGEPRVRVPGLLGYVLAGNTMRWPIDLPPTSSIANIQIKARLNDEPHAQELHVVDSGD